MKKTLLWLLVLSMLLTLFSCGKTGPATSDTTQAADDTSAVDPVVSWSVELTDQAGRKVTFDKKAEKVVSCYYITTYAMLSLGIADCLVGIEKKADTRAIYKMAKPELLNLPVVGSLKEIDVEKIVSLTPDLVLLPKKLSDNAETLESFGIKTLIVNPETDEQMRDMMALIANACGVPEKVTALYSWIDAKLDGFKAPANKPKVLCLSNSSFLSAAPKNMYQNTLIELAGGTNAFASSEETYWVTVSYETLLSLNPDYFIIPAGASYTAEDILKDEQLKTLAAGKVLVMPGTFEEWDSPIPSGVLGVLWMRMVLGTSSYSAEAFKKDVVEFYETFYGFTPSAEALATLG